jgi:hypothetical protein
VHDAAGVSDGPRERLFAAADAFSSSRPRRWRGGSRRILLTMMLETGSEKPVQRPALRRRGTSAGISANGSRSSAAA